MSAKPVVAQWNLPSGKLKETIVPMLASHCPFCGTPIEETNPETEIPL